MYVLDSVSTSPWTGELDDVYPVKIDIYSPLNGTTKEPGVPFDINYTVKNTHSTTSLQVWGKLYLGQGPGGQLLSSFTSPGLIAPNGTYTAAATTVQITAAQYFYIEVGHTEYLFTAYENPAVGGTITGTPDGNISAGQQVSVTASSPNPGYSWGGWTATGITLSNPNSLTQTFNMPIGDVILVANFPSAPIYHRLTCSTTGTGTGSISTNPANACGSDILQGTLVTLTANVTSGTFTGWTVDGSTSTCPGSGSCSVNMNAPHTVVATFTAADPTGACCVGTNCSITTQTNCTGIWKGAGTSCSPNPCGTVTCGQYTTPQACALNGCYWWTSDNSCHDVPEPNCAQYTNVNTCIQNDCEWWNNGCHPSAPLCTEIDNSLDCGYYGCYWWSNGTCNSTPETPPCSTYNNDPQGCAQAGCIYDPYTNICSSTAPPPPISQNMIIVAAAALAGIAIISLLSRRKK